MAASPVSVEARGAAVQVGRSEENGCQEVGVVEDAGGVFGPGGKGRRRVAGSVLGMMC